MIECYKWHEFILLLLFVFFVWFDLYWLKLIYLDVSGGIVQWAEILTNNDQIIECFLLFTFLFFVCLFVWSVLVEFKELGELKINITFEIFEDTKTLINNCESFFGDRSNQHIFWSCFAYANHFRCVCVVCLYLENRIFSPTYFQ